MVRQNYGKKFSKFITLNLILLISLLTLPLICQAGEKKSADQVVAEVNGEPIKKELLSERARIYRIVMALRSVPLFAEFLMETDEGEKSLDKYRNYVLEKLITEEIIDQKAESLNIKVTEDEIDERLKTIIDRTKEVDSKGELLDRLEKDRRSLRDLQKEISHKLVREKVKKRVVGEVLVSDEKIEDYYAENRDSFRGSDGEVKKLEEVRHQIREKIRRDRRNRVWRDWLKKARKKAEVVKKLDS